MKKKIYHGSDHIVKTPRYHGGKPHNDYGYGFYCTESSEMAKEVLELGMYIAFGGSLTFKNSQKPVEAAKYVPLDRILLETDCPYLAPEPNRGKRNSSLYMHYVAEKLAEIKGISVEEVEKTTTKNAKELFRIN